MSRKGLEITLEQARAHAAKHGYALDEPGSHDKTPGGGVRLDGGHPGASDSGKKRQMAHSIPKPVKMTRPEREYGMILEAQKRRGWVIEYRFEGISLSWGVDPETGRKMWYTPDFFVRYLDGTPEGGGIIKTKLVEVKGGGEHALQYSAVVRFKGARAEWPMFQFEMWQLASGEWRRIQ